MRFHRQLPVIAVAGGVVGALLRAMQLATGFEPGTALYQSDNLWGQLLTGWLLLTVLLCAFFAWRGQHYASFEELFGCKNTFCKAVLALSGLLLAAGGIAWLPTALQTAQTLTENNDSWFLMLEIPFGILCIVTGLCLVGIGAVLAREEITARQAQLTIPPLFWAAFHLLVVYRQYCVSANLALFMTEIFASIACVMAFYSYSKLLYGKPEPRQFTFWATLAFVLALTDVIGYLLSLKLGNDAVHWTLGTEVRGGCLLMGNVFLFCELWLITGRQFPPQRAPYSPDLQDNGPAAGSQHIPGHSDA